MSNAAAQYIGEVNRYLTCPNSVKKAFLRQLEAEAADFCEDCEDVDTDALSERFGQPDEVAEEFLSELSIQTVNRCAGTRKMILGLTLGILLAAAVFAAVIRVRTGALQQEIPADGFFASVTYDAGSGSGTVWDSIWEYLFH